MVTSCYSLLQGTCFIRYCCMLQILKYTTTLTPKFSFHFRFYKTHVRCTLIVFAVVELDALFCSVAILAWSTITNSSEKMQIQLLHSNTLRCTYNNLPFPIAHIPVKEVNSERDERTKSFSFSFSSETRNCFNNCYSSVYIWKQSVMLQRHTHTTWCRKRE